MLFLKLLQINQNRLLNQKRPEGIIVFYVHLKHLDMYLQELLNGLLQYYNIMRPSDINNLISASFEVSIPSN